MPGMLNEQVQVLRAEDIILFKLQWCWVGGEVSEKQWTDIKNVIKTQGDELDSSYLSEWATVIGVKDLLDRLRSEC